MALFVLISWIFQSADTARAVYITSSYFLFLQSNSNSVLQTSLRTSLPSKRQKSDLTCCQRCKCRLPSDCFKISELVYPDYFNQKTSKLPLKQLQVHFATFFMPLLLSSLSPNKCRKLLPFKSLEFKALPLSVRLLGKCYCNITAGFAVLTQLLVIALLD